MLLGPGSSINQSEQTVIAGKVTAELMPGDANVMIVSADEGSRVRYRDGRVVRYIGGRWVEEKPAPRVVHGWDKIMLPPRGCKRVGW